MKLTPSKALKEIGLLKENGCYIKSTVEYKIVETALKDYELYEKILKDYGFNFANFREACFTLAQFRGSGFTNIEKKLKALEIIKEALKSENKIGLQDNHFDYVDFNENYLCIDGTISLTKEQFDLLKEELK